MVGGTFDPPHLAHLVLAAAARRALALDRVMFVVAADPWLKAERAVSPAVTRLRMLRGAIAPLVWAEASTVELERSGPSYASDTMTALAQGGGEWWFVLGADALADLPRWHEPQRLLAVARLAVAQRPDAALALGELARAVPGVEARLDPVTMPSLWVSSTELRARARAGRSLDVLVSQTVQAVIAELGLYGGG